ncbi:hypothetical protein U8V72_28095 [Priestia filamentosa]|uniref:hypothetical protein n=1 Tax=Priestia filamentosa TaxID=1402861 RepID=UPI0005895DD7
MHTEEELYLTLEEMKYEINNTSGLEIIEEKEEYLWVRDNLDNNHRVLRFNTETHEFNDELIESFGQDVSKYRILECIHMLPKILLMNLQKVYIISTNEHLRSVEEETNVYTFDLYNRGMYIWETGDVVISLRALEEEAELASENELEIEGQTDYEENVRLLLWRTLTKELFRSLQSNPIFEHEVEQGDEVVEDFCELYFSPAYA